MAVSLRNLLILDKYWRNRPRRIRGVLPARPDFLKGMSIALSSPEEIG
jgi:hypothetical protein